MCAIDSCLDKLLISLSSHNTCYDVHLHFFDIKVNRISWFVHVNTDCWMPYGIHIFMLKWYLLIIVLQHSFSSILKSLILWIVFDNSEDVDSAISNVYGWGFNLAVFHWLQLKRNMGLELLHYRYAKWIDWDSQTNVKRFTKMYQIHK